MAIRLITFLSEQKKKELIEAGPRSLEDLIRSVMAWEEDEESKTKAITREEFIDVVIGLLWLGLKQEERDEQEDKSLPN